MKKSNEIDTGLTVGHVKYLLQQFTEGVISDDSPMLVCVDEEHGDYTFIRSVKLCFSDFREKGVHAPPFGNSAPNCLVIFLKYKSEE